MLRGCVHVTGASVYDALSSLTFESACTQPTSDAGHWMSSALSVASNFPDSAIEPSVRVAGFPASCTLQGLNIDATCINVPHTVAICVMKPTSDCKMPFTTMLI